MSQSPLVAIIMGSRSDWPTMKGAAESLDALGVAYEAKVVSAHRTPERLYAFAKGAKGGRLQGDHRRRRRRGSPAGHDRLAHRPAGAGRADPEQERSRAWIPCSPSSRCRPACRWPPWRWARAGARNAGLLAARILALADPALAERLEAYGAKLTASVAEAVEDVESL